MNDFYTFLTFAILAWLCFHINLNIHNNATFKFATFFWGVVSLIAAVVIAILIFADYAK